MFNVKEEAVFIGRGGFLVILHLEKKSKNEKDNNIILDFDGTLGDTASVIIQTMQATIKELNLPNRSDEECAAMIGLRLIEIPAVLFPECGNMGELYAETYRRLFYTFNTDGAVNLYPHVLETLEQLKKRGITMTIASSRSHASLAQYVESLGLASLISYILGADDVKKGKPNPEPVNKILGIFRFKAEETLVVGDTTFDIQMGKNAETMTCGVSYGNGNKESLTDADWVIDDFSELLELTE